MPEFRPRRGKDDLYRGRLNGKAKPDGKVPLLLTGMRAVGDEDVTLPEAAIARVHCAAKDGGELRGLVQEQVEWLRHWIAIGRLAPKDALLNMRGIQKSMQDCMDRESQIGTASVTVDMSISDTAAATLAGAGVHIREGDDLIVH